MYPQVFLDIAKKYEQPVEDVEFKILEAMTTYGGSFVVCLSQLYRLADPINERKIASTFEDYFRAYADKVFTKKSAKLSHIYMLCQHCSFRKHAYTADLSNYTREKMEQVLKECIPAYRSVKVHMGRQHKDKTFKYEEPRYLIVDGKKLEEVK